MLGEANHSSGVFANGGEDNTKAGVATYVSFTPNRVLPFSDDTQSCPGLDIPWLVQLFQ